MAVTSHQATSPQLCSSHKPGIATEPTFFVMAQLYLVQHVISSYIRWYTTYLVVFQVVHSGVPEQILHYVLRALARSKQPKVAVIKRIYHMPTTCSPLPAAYQQHLNPHAALKSTTQKKSPSYCFAAEGSTSIYWALRPSICGLSSILCCVAAYFAALA